MKLLITFALAAAMLAAQDDQGLAVVTAKLEAAQAANAAQQAAMAVADAETKLMAAQFRYQQATQRAQELLREAIAKDEAVKALEAGEGPEGGDEGKAKVKRARP